MYEYIVTAFKVVVGVITNDRLAIAALVALGLMIIWVVFSLVFSFQARFARGAKNINNYVSRNGIADDAKDGLLKLVKKMPSEFQRGFNNYDKDPSSLPSSHIKRFESLDVELSGGVFNQNRSILKTYINFIFVGLLVFSFAILPSEEALTGYTLAEALVTPLLFVFIAKIIYYVYTAIRQYQYHNAVDDFNDMLDNLDKAVQDTYVLAGKSDSSVNSYTNFNWKKNDNSSSKTVSQYDVDNNIVDASDNSFDKLTEKQGDEKENIDLENNEDIKHLNSGLTDFEPEVSEESFETDKSTFADEGDSVLDNKAQEFANVDQGVEQVEETKGKQIEESKETENSSSNTSETEENLDLSPNYELGEKQESQIEPQQEISQEPIYNENEAVNDSEKDNLNAESDTKLDNEEPSGAVQESNKDTEEAKEPLTETENGIEEDKMEENKNNDNFSLDFASLLDEDEAEKPKRGRGRPRKEVSQSGEFVITNDKEFEDALSRAEKLMRKNEEPLSASQTKRIEKQIKQLVDAMTKYKEGK